ncbi:ChaN family lipoprotein [Rhodovulum visakhapatnamense]|uniref:Putative iron-regulated protein n=1 Tax=Rhodovulum visakhapatnamense TaxID=364297 RepID=A0A4R8FLH5_9RHOB|nr:ChaN family lipoprotein [Rhodovulum visakhapatnamense]TDX27094.1 putative iron-regulated protein [Rhodovulum visakhapatnamense]
MRHVARIAALAVALTAHAVGAEEIGPAAFASLPAADVVVLGETHDNPDQHANQAAAVKALAPRALVFEMLTPEQAAKVTPGLRLDGVALGQALGWEASGWPDFAMYFPIFSAAPEARIYGAALPRDEVRRAVTDGAAAVFGADAATYGLTDPLPEAEGEQRINDQREAHCNALPEHLLPGMVEAQRLRDAALARAARQALDDTGGPVAVIAGNGHARTDWGLPAAFARVAEGARLISVGQLEGAATGSPPYDYWLVTGAADRGDPCAALTGG